MNQGLFESLVGTFADGTPIEAVGVAGRRMISIMDHLNRLFNTRAGSITHIPDYGLPDISEVYRKMPFGVDELKQAIRKAVEMYEPRLRRAKVVQKEIDPGECKLVFILTAELHDGRQIRFETTFSSTGRSTLAPWKKSEPS